MSRIKTIYLDDWFQRLDIAEDMISELEDRTKNYPNSAPRCKKVTDGSGRKI